MMQPDCPNRPPGVREYEELQRGSHPQTWHPQTWDLATVAQVEALRGEVAQLQRDAEYLRAHIEDQLKGMVEDRLAGLVQSVTAMGERLAALEARQEGEDRRPVSTESGNDDFANLISLPDGDEQAPILNHPKATFLESGEKSGDSWERGDAVDAPGRRKR